MKPIHETPAGNVQNPARRALVKASVAFSALGVLAGPTAVRRVLAADAPAALDAFHQASVFLTSRQVDAVMAARCHDALKKRIPDLDDKVAAINQLVHDKQLAHMDDYLALQGVDPAVDTGAKDIVRALYLGVVGDDEKAELFAYEQALMYDATRDVLVVPTYGRGFETWGPKPAEGKTEK